MSALVTPYLVLGVLLFALGVRGLLATSDTLRRVIAVNVMGNGVFLVLVTLARRVSADATDPVPHAMVLTGIVVAVCATALALTLGERLADARDGGDDQ